jgi:hypothetical protein
MYSGDVTMGPDVLLVVDVVTFCLSCYIAIVYGEPTYKVVASRS